jgi:hypothetical protein
MYTYETFTKAIEDNQKFVTEYATQLTATTTEFTKKLTEIATDASTAYRDQVLATFKTFGVPVPAGKSK